MAKWPLRWEIQRYASHRRRPRNHIQGSVRGWFSTYSKMVESQNITKMMDNAARRGWLNQILMISFSKDEDRLESEMIASKETLTPAAANNDCTSVKKGGKPRRRGRRWRGGSCVKSSQNWRALKINSSSLKKRVPEHCLRRGEDDKWMMDGGPF